MVVQVKIVVYDIKMSEVVKVSAIGTHYGPYV